MNIPDPLSILQSILLLLDYGNRIAGAGEEIQGYHRTISRTTDLVSEICSKLEAENAVLQCHSTLSRIDMKLFFVKELRMQGEGSLRHGPLIRP